MQESVYFLSPLLIWEVANGSLSQKWSFIIETRIQAATELLQ